MRRRSGSGAGSSSYSAGMLYSLASFAAIGAVTLFTSVLSARLYGIRVVGEAALVLAPIAIVTLLSTVREQPAMVRELAKLRPRHPRVTGVAFAVFTFSFALTLTVTVLAVLGCYFAFHGPLDHPSLFAPAAVGLCGYLLVINTAWNIDGVLGAFRAGRELFWVRLHQALVYGVLVAAFALLADTVWGLLWAFLASWVTALAHRVLLLRRFITVRVPTDELRAGFGSLREIVGFGLKLTPGSLATGGSEASGTWILGATSSLAAVGAYSRAWTFATRLTEVNWRITEMLLPTLVQRRHAGESESFDSVLADSLRYAAFGMLVPAAVLGGAAEQVMGVFGAGFASAAPALRLLLFVPLLQTLTAIQGTALMAHNRPLLSAYAQIVRFAVTAVAGVLLARSLGTTGMALAMVIGSSVSFCVYLVILRTDAAGAIKALLRPRCVLGLAGGYASGFAVSRLIVEGLGGGLGLLTALVLGLVVYVAVAVTLSGTTERDRARLRIVIEKLLGARVATAGAPGATS